MRQKGNSGYPPTHKQERFGQYGMTLIEVMIVVVIVAILAAIAYPSYQDQVRKSRRAEGKALLLEAQARQERFFTENNTYAANMTALGYGSNSEPTENNWYQVSVAAATGGCPITSCFSLLATRQGAQASDTDCGNLTIDSLGTKGVVSATSSADDCW